MTEQIKLPAGYTPSEKEEYMCPMHLEYFRQQLLNWRQELIEESQETISNLREEVRDVGDEAERATRETESTRPCAVLMMAAMVTAKKPVRKSVWPDCRRAQ
jgi:hypothetical protein